MFMKQVACIKELELPMHDVYGYGTDDYIIVPKGTIFNWDEENTHRIIGGDIYLENDKTWIEITTEDFKEYFKEVKNV